MREELEKRLAHLRQTLINLGEENRLTERDVGRAEAYEYACREEIEFLETLLSPVDFQN